MKYKVISIIILIIILMFLCLSCFNSIKTINVLSDDISIYEIVDKFNAENKNIKVFINYYNNKTEKENIFKYIKKNKIINFDIVIGNNSCDNIIDSKYFNKIAWSTKKSNINEINNLYQPAVDFIIKNNNYALLYKIDFPVILARKDNINKDYINKKELDIEDFCQIASSVNKKMPDKKNTETMIGFIPSVSNLNEIDFYFIFNSSIIKENNKYSFNTINTQKAYKFYYEYDNDYNFGKQESLNYLKKFTNIEKNYFLKQKIILFDFLELSKAFSYPNDLYKIFLIKNLKQISINNKIITIPKKSINKKEAEIFIDYIYNDNTQTFLLKNTTEKIDYYLNVHIPVKKGLFQKLENLTFLNSDINLDDYINKLKYADFYNNKIQKKFFDKYFDAKELIKKGTLQEKNILNYITKELNK